MIIFVCHVFYSIKPSLDGVLLHICFCAYVLSIPSKLQGRRRALKSGPAKDIVECRRHERGRAREEVNRKGGSGDLPREIFDKLVPLNAF